MNKKSVSNSCRPTRFANATGLVFAMTKNGYVERKSPVNEILTGPILIAKVEPEGVEPSSR